MLAAASLIAWLMSLTRGDIAYLLVFVWAFIGIAVEHAGAPVVSIGAWVATAIVAAALVAALVLRGRRQAA
jgi:hypothetical protein